MKNLLNLLGSFVLGSLSIVNGASFITTSTSKLSEISLIKSTIKTTATSINDDYYNYSKNLDPSKKHNNYEYTIGIGLNDLKFLVGTTYTFVDYPMFDNPEKVTHTAGSFSIDNPVSPIIGGHLSATVLVLWMLYGNSYVDTVSPNINRFSYYKTFTSDMNGMEHDILDNVIADWSQNIGHAFNDFQAAYSQNKGVLFTYETWYTDPLHASMSGEIIGQVRLVNKWS